MNFQDAHLIPLYQTFPLEVVRGSGALLYDQAGREYVDLSGGYGVAIVGHANPRVADAIAEQARKLITCHTSIYNDSRERYIALLVKYLPSELSRVFFGNSGAEANEAAIKFARKATGRPNIVAFTGSFHGKTLGALSATWNQKYPETLRTPGARRAIFAVRKPREGQRGNRRDLSRRYWSNPFRAKAVFTSLRTTFCPACEKSRKPKVRS